MASANRPRSRTRTWSRPVVVAALATCVAMACGGKSSSSSTPSHGAQPAPGATGFVSGTLNDVPTLGRMRPLGPERAADGVTSRSYRLIGQSAGNALETYGNVLERAGWDVGLRPHRTGTRAWQGAWVRDGRTLVVSTVDAPTVESAGESSVQVSLSLYPAGVTPSTF